MDTLEIYNYKNSIEDVLIIEHIKYYEDLLNTPSVGNYIKWPSECLLDRYLTLKRFYSHIKKFGLI